MNDILLNLTQIIESRKLANGGKPDTSYVAYLFAKGDDAILKKVGEESAETIIAAKNARLTNNLSELLYECADLWFHTLILLAHFNLKPKNVLDELQRRQGLSGLQEKKNR